MYRISLDLAAESREGPITESMIMAIDYSRQYKETGDNGLVHFLPVQQTKEDIVSLSDMP